jgi:hypothetical protein
MRRQGTSFHPSRNVTMKKIRAEEFYVDVRVKIKKNIYYLLVFCGLFLLPCFPFCVFFPCNKTYIYIKLCVTAILLCSSKKYSAHSWRISFPFWMDFGVVDLQVMSLTNDEFRAYWCNGNHILIKGLKDIFHYRFLFTGFGKICYFI